MSNIVHIKAVHNDPSFALLTTHTTFVHFSGYPTRWAIVLILERCPSIAMIRITISQERFLSKEARAILAARGVVIATGNKERTSEKKYGKTLEERRSYLETLSGTPLNRLTDLLSKKYLWAEALLHAYGARGFIQMPVADICRKYGLRNERGLNHVTNGILQYIDPLFDFNGETKKFAASLRKKMHIGIKKKGWFPNHKRRLSG